MIISDPPVDTEQWIAAFSPPDAQDEPDDDPNDDGITTVGFPEILGARPNSYTRLRAELTP